MKRALSTLVLGLGVLPVLVSLGVWLAALVALWDLPPGVERNIIAGEYSDYALAWMFASIVSVPAAVAFDMALDRKRLSSVPP